MTRIREPFLFTTGPVEAGEFADVLRIPSASVPLFFVARALPTAVRSALADFLPVPDPAHLRHAAQETTLHRWPGAREELTVTPSLEAEGDYGFRRAVTLRTRIRGAAGDDVADLLTTLTVGPARGDGRLPRRPVTTGGSGPVLLTWRERVPDDLPRRYAEASGDRNPVHLSDAAAHRAGLPGVIVHGMATLLLAVAGLTARMFDGDGAAVTAVRTRFVRPVRPGDELTLGVHATGAPGSYALHASVAGQPVLKDTLVTRAAAEVR
ncbi:MaoC family dehydratase [Streptomyces sp. NPDC006645]|uniref:MaoC family dehydratase n=1 Tax=unclassified Streptomyces TaxID=2593676 RepID=UPI0033A00107